MTAPRNPVLRLNDIGEAVVALPLEFRESHAQVAWQQAIWMRNQLIHGYAEIDYSIVWDTAVLDIPTLLTQVADILTDMEGSPR